MDKRGRLDTVEAALELVSGDAAAVTLLRGVHSAIRTRPHVTNSLSTSIRREKVRFTNDVADVLELVAQDLSFLRTT